MIIHFFCVFSWWCVKKNEGMIIHFFCVFSWCVKMHINRKKNGNIDGHTQGITNHHRIDAAFDML